MAASKIARRVAGALAEALLEWILIAALLLNGVFAYLIARFAAYFGLRPPCILCSRVDSLFESGRLVCRDVFCGAHAAELLKLDCRRHGAIDAVVLDQEDGLSDAKRLVPLELLDEMTVIDAVDMVRLDDDDSDDMNEEESPAVDVRVIHEEKTAVSHPPPPLASDASRDIVQVKDLGTGTRHDAPALEASKRIVPEGDCESYNAAVVDQDQSLSIVLRQGSSSGEQSASADIETNSEVSIGSEICEHPAVSQQLLCPPALDVAVQDEDVGVSENCRAMVDQLKSALEAKASALASLYAELEEERNAAAIAASQTMAMINRLQEEKAAMQMEALQYQRVMEEQSEYDQEALQLLNELVAKREREKEDVERELDLYKHRVLLYESKATRGEVAGDSDGADEESSEFSGHDEVEEPLAYFETERMAIADELKALEKRLESSSSSPASGSTDSCCKGKRLLPLFDAVDGIADEVADVRERLRALEADKEFLWHCIKSMKKGGKGMQMLRVILQHLSELRSAHALAGAGDDDDAAAALRSPSP